MPSYCAGPELCMDPWVGQEAVRKTAGSEVIGSSSETSFMGVWTVNDLNVAEKQKCCDVQRSRS